jgi:cytochrome c oxidase subunit 2
VPYIKVIYRVLLLIFVFTGCGKVGNKNKSKAEILRTGSVIFEKYGCQVCHSLNGEIIYGPPLNDIYMKEVQVVRKGEIFTLITDRDYLKRAIQDPRYEKVLEYQNKDMPVPHISKEEINTLVEYLIALQNGNDTLKMNQ